MVLPKYFLLTARKILILPKSSKLGGAIAPPAPPAGTAMAAGIDYLKMAEEQQSNLDLQNLKQNNTTSLLLKDVTLGETGATLLCDDSQRRLRPLVPKSMRRAVFQHFHSSSHPGIKSGTKSIGRLMVWRDMRKDIRQWTKECQACTRSKVIRRNTANVEAVTPPPPGRFTQVYQDIIGPLGLSKGHNYVLTVIDRFSRFFQAVPLAGITAEECVDRFIRHWVSLFGCPERIYCDRGRQFTSTVWNDCV